MMNTGRFIRSERPIYGTNVGLSVKANWRQLPPMLYKLKERDCSIEKAKYFQDWTSMYIKTPHNIQAKEVHTMLEDEMLNGMYVANNISSTLYSPGLPFNTTIYIYNISTCPYTVLDFGCYDRTGLFCEIIEVLSKYDIDIKAAYINTIGSVVSNIFYITHKDQKLNDKYIEYLRNNLDAEVRPQDTDSY